MVLSIDGRLQVYLPIPSSNGGCNVPATTTTATPAHHRTHCDWHSWDHVREDSDVVALMIPSRWLGGGAENTYNHGGCTKI